MSSPGGDEYFIETDYGKDTTKSPLQSVPLRSPMDKHSVSNSTPSSVANKPASKAALAAVAAAAAAAAYISSSKSSKKAAKSGASTTGTPSTKKRTKATVSTKRTPVSSKKATPSTKNNKPKKISVVKSSVSSPSAKTTAAASAAQSKSITKKKPAIAVPLTTAKKSTPSKSSSSTSTSFSGSASKAMSTPAKKRKIAELESMETEIKAKIAKLKTEQEKFAARLQKEQEKEQQEREKKEAIKFPVKDEYLLRLNLSPLQSAPASSSSSSCSSSRSTNNSSNKKPLKDIPPALMNVSTHLLRSDDETVGNDAVAVWDFINVFGKQLLGVGSLLSLKDFTDLLLFDEHECAALNDLFCCLLREIFADSTMLSKINTSLPRRFHYLKRERERNNTLSSSSSSSAQAISAIDNQAKGAIENGSCKDDNDDNSSSNSSSIAQWVMAVGTGTAFDFDCSANCMKVLPKGNLTRDSIDALRWQAVLRTVLLRLEPVQLLRRAADDVATALHYSSSLPSSQQSSSVMLKSGQEEEGEVVAKKKEGLKKKQHASFAPSVPVLRIGSAPPAMSSVQQVMYLESAATPLNKKLKRLLSIMQQQEEEQEEEEEEQKARNSSNIGAIKFVSPEDKKKTKTVAAAAPPPLVASTSTPFISEFDLCRVTNTPRHIKMPRISAASLSTSTSTSSSSSSSAAALTALGAGPAKYITTGSTYSSAFGLHTYNRGSAIGFIDKDAVFKVTSNPVAQLEQISAAAAALEEQEMHRLSVEHKLRILRVLCETCMCTDRFKLMMENNAETRADKTMERNKQQRELKANKRETNASYKEEAMRRCREVNARTIKASAEKLSIAAEKAWEKHKVAVDAAAAKSKTASSSASSSSTPNGKKLGKGAAAAAAAISAASAAASAKDIAALLKKANLAEAAATKAKEIATAALKGSSFSSSSSSSSRSSSGGGKAKKDPLDPTLDQLNNMIEDIVLLEQLGIDMVIDDLELEEMDKDGEEEALLRDEDDDDDNDDDDDEEEEVVEEDGSGGYRVKSKRTSRRVGAATSRAKAMEKKALQQRKLEERRKELAQRRARNDLISTANNRINAAIESRADKDVALAIKAATRAGMKGTQGSGRAAKSFITQRLKQVYKIESELEQQAMEEREQWEHEKQMQEYCIRTQPLGSDRFGRFYWSFIGDDHRIFVQHRESTDSVAAAACLATADKVAEAVLPTLTVGAALAAGLASSQVSASVLNTSTAAVVASALAEDSGEDASGVVAPVSVLNKLYCTRPNQFRYTWSVYANSELWQLWDALDERGEREGALKKTIKAMYDLEEPELVFMKTGSKYIGKKVKHVYKKGKQKPLVGTIVGWLPAGGAGEDEPELFHVMSMDNREDELELEEVLEALLPGQQLGEKEEGEEQEEEQEKHQAVGMKRSLPSSSSIDSNSHNKRSSSRVAAVVQTQALVEAEVAKKVEKPEIVRKELGICKINLSRAVDRSLGGGSSNASLLSSAETIPPCGGLAALKNDIGRAYGMLSDVYKKRAGNTSVGAAMAAALKTHLYKIQPSASVDALSSDSNIFSREGRKLWDVTLKSCEDLAAVKCIIDELEVVVHDMQLGPDRKDEEQEALVRQRKIALLKAEGWLFEAPPVPAPVRASSGGDDDVKQEKEQQGLENTTGGREATTVDRSSGSEYIGKNVRRFFRNFGMSDGRILCYLPADCSEEGVTLFHMEHDDGDAEDLEEEDVMHGIRCYDNNMLDDGFGGEDGAAGAEDDSSDDLNADIGVGGEAAAAAEEEEKLLAGIGLTVGGDRCGNDGEDSDDDDDDDEEETAAAAAAAPRLWPTAETRERWRSVLRAANTYSEASFCLDRLLEHAKAFGAVCVEVEDAAAKKKLNARGLAGASSGGKARNGNSTSTSSGSRGSSSFQKSSSVSSSRGGRVGGGKGGSAVGSSLSPQKVASQQSSRGGSGVYISNTGRPLRAAAAIVSYAE